MSLPFSERKCHITDTHLTRTFGLSLLLGQCSKASVSYFPYKWTLQGFLATGETVRKCGDRPFSKRLQATEVIRKVTTICDSGKLQLTCMYNFRFCSKATGTFSTMEQATEQLQNERQATQDAPLEGPYKPHYC